MSRERAQEWLTNKLGVYLPYYSMGKVDTFDLFGPNEMILFAFYQHNRHRYKRVLDIGANVGLHSLLMAQLEWEVRAFEPDPEVFGKLTENLYFEAPEVWLHNVAVSDRDGEAQFTRVINNLTGSCLVGSAKEPYGPLEEITVKTVDCRPLLDWADLAKLDVEGHEATLLKCLTADHLTHLDLICEIRGDREAASVMRHIHDIGGSIYTQKTGWGKANCMADMPTKHQEGSIFISSRRGPW